MAGIRVWDGDGRRDRDVDTALAGRLILSATSTLGPDAIRPRRPRAQGVLAITGSGPDRNLASGHADHERITVADGSQQADQENA